jgi:cell fate (sporulation/competence/biofilm development) regulator YlbF (YheA/YmcA/DUF963 family)
MQRSVQALSVMEKATLDMSALLLHSYELGDMILASREVADYLHWKQEMAKDEEVQSFIKKLDRQKVLFEECQRFGHFHPDYHKAMEAVRLVQEDLDALPSIRGFKEAEEKLDDLLYAVSETIARSVSDTIKVPTNKLLPESGGCSSGGSCSGKCG